MVSGEDLEALSDLAQKSEGCTCRGQPVVWTVKEQAVLKWLGATHAVHRRW